MENVEAKEVENDLKANRYSIARKKLLLVIKTKCRTRCADDDQKRTEKSKLKLEFRAVTKNRTRNKISISGK